jgi:hypothetical protein
MRLECQMAELVIKSECTAVTTHLRHSSVPDKGIARHFQVQLRSQRLRAGKSVYCPRTLSPRPHLHFQGQRSSSLLRPQWPPPFLSPWSEIHRVNYLRPVVNKIFSYPGYRGLSIGAGILEGGVGCAIVDCVSGCLSHQASSHLLHFDPVHRPLTSVKVH